MAVGLAAGLLLHTVGQNRHRVYHQHRHVFHLAHHRGAGERRRLARARAACCRPLQHHLGGDQRRRHFSSAARSSKIWLPKHFLPAAGDHAGQFGLVFWLEKIQNPPAADSRRNHAAAAGPEPAVAARAKTFLRMAWLANPFAYIAINTLLAVHAGHRRQIPAFADVCGICLLAVVLCAAGRVHCALALDRLALPVPLAGRRRLRVLILSFATILCRRTLPCSSSRKSFSAVPSA